MRWFFLAHRWRCCVRSARKFRSRAPSRRTMDAPQPPPPPVVQLMLQPTIKRRSDQNNKACQLRPSCVRGIPPCRSCAYRTFRRIAPARHPRLAPLLRSRRHHPRQPRRHQPHLTRATRLVSPRRVCSCRTLLRPVRPRPWPSSRATPSRRDRITLTHAPCSPSRVPRSHRPH